MQNYLLKKKRTCNFGMNHQDTLTRASLAAHNPGNVKAGRALPDAPTGYVDNHRGRTDHEREKVAALLMETMEAEALAKKKAEQDASDMERQHNSEEGKHQRERRQAKEAAAARVRAMVDGDHEEVREEIEVQDAFQLQEKQHRKIEDRSAAAARIRATLDADDDESDLAAPAVLHFSAASETSAHVSESNPSEQTAAVAPATCLPTACSEAHRKAAAAARIRATLELGEESEEDEGKENAANQGVAATPTSTSDAAKSSGCKDAVAGHEKVEDMIDAQIKPRQPVQKAQDKVLKRKAEDEEKRRLQRERRLAQRTVVLDD